MGWVQKRLVVSAWVVLVGAMFSRCCCGVRAQNSSQLRACLAHEGSPQG